MWPLTVVPDRAQYRPGKPIALLVRAQGEAGVVAELRVRITRLGREVASWSEPLALGEAGCAEHTLGWEVPDRSPVWQAFGVDLALVCPGAGARLAETSTAVDVAPHWQVAPRYGFLSDFGPGEHDDAAVLDRMLELHLSCVQFYDWMYTHHTYVPPTPVFVDPLGRQVDFERVRARVAGCRARGMAPIAYASVYGGEQPFASEHPEWQLYDGAGSPMSLAGVFFIQDPSPNSGWRSHLLRQYRVALELGFQGLHCDTYGSPKAGIARRTDHQAVVRLEHVLPGLVAEADALARSHDPLGGAIFNAVGAWPLEAIARTPAASPLYIEVWPPNETYRDLYELVMRARRLDPARQVILAAYLPAFLPERERPTGALAGLRLAAAAIFASGGFYLLPGEGSHILADAYYPKQGALEPADWQVLRAYWDFQTRYGPLLADPGATDISTTHCGPGIRECRLLGARYSPMAQPRTVWTILKEGAGYQTLHLVNLTGVSDPRWTIPQPDAAVVRGLSARLEVLTPPEAVWVASPDRDDGRPALVPHRIEYEAGVGQVLVVELPPLEFWSMLVVEWPDASGS